MINTDHPYRHKMKTCNWFENWFDTNYYHLLYKHRDDKEADIFISNLIHFLIKSNVKIDKSQKALDLACGRGRHSIILNNHNLNVTGFDLSEKSIQFAKQFENDSLKFEVKDMRKDLGSNKFNIIFNLFTSFGYFDDEKDDLLVLKNIANALTPAGIFVFDFLNSHIIQNLTFSEQTTTIDGVIFKSSKQIKDNFIIKKIEVIDKSKTFTYAEQVKLIDKVWFEEQLPKVGLVIEHVFGDYNLNPFDALSQRLIIIARKK